MQASGFIKLADAAHKLSLSYNTAYRFALTGELPSEKRGGRWMVDAQAVERMQAERAKTDREPAA